MKIKIESKHLKYFIWPYEAMKYIIGAYPLGTIIMFFAGILCVAGGIVGVFASMVVAVEKSILLGILVFFATGMWCWIGFDISNWAARELK